MTLRVVHVSISALAAGCFAPTPAFDLPCSADRECPAGQRCDLDTLICRGELADGAPADAAAAADAPPGTPDARPDAATLAPFGPPMALAALNSTGTDADASLTADGLELYFASDRIGTSGGLDIYVAVRTEPGDPFTSATRVAELSSVAQDDCPDVSPDGLVMYLVSTRGGQLDVYRATRSARTAPWGAPALDPDLSGATDEYGVVISADRRVGIVDRVAASGGRELYQRIRTGEGAPWGPLVHLASLSSTAIDGAPGVDETGRVIYFHSDRDIAGDINVYRATRADPDDPFGAPVRVQELDAPAADDSNPWVAADDRTVLFDSQRPGGLGALDLYVATRP